MKREEKRKKSEGRPMIALGPSLILFQLPHPAIEPHQKDKNAEPYHRGDDADNIEGMSL